MGLKQVIVVNSDLEMSKGKLAAQASHASLNAYLKSDEELRSEWKASGAKKVVVEASGSGFSKLLQKAETLNIPCYKVNDAGLTELEPGAETALGLGPDKASKIDKVTGELELVD
ncbi:MAG: peptidyl-tRNA hydrolase Pth2 [Candidatus Nanohaloarchaea archaeon]